MEQRKALVAISVLNSVSNVLQWCVEDTNSSDGETSDEEIRTVLKVSGRERNEVTRIKLYLEVTIPNYSEEQFHQHFRVSRRAFEVLLGKIGPILERKGNIGRQTINIEKQLLSVLWLLATPDSYRSVAERFDMGKSSLSVSYFRVIKALNNISADIISWPLQNQLPHIKESFKSIAKLNNVIGAVDGTFVPIKAPKHDSEVYITRKCHYAVTLQAVCDCDLRFTDVFVGYPGSVSDARIFRNSDLYFKVEETPGAFFSQQEFIIGDKAYPLLPWCIPPYIDRGTLTLAQKNFNEMHARTRQVIERAFALLFGRFRRLKFLDMNRHDFIPATVLAACVLHNICLDSEDTFAELYIDEGRNNVHSNEDVERISGEHIQQASIRRDNICFELYNIN